MEEIGRRLQATRVAKGITLQEVEEETRIRKKYIEALESGRTVLIPGEVYVKGFLRTYGNFLGLDGEALVEEYKRRESAPAEASGSEGPAAEPPVGAEVEPEAVVARPLGEAAPQAPRAPAFVPAPRRSAQRSGRERGKRQRGRSPGPGVYLFRRALVALLVILPFAGLGYWLWNRPAAVPQQAPPDTGPGAVEPAPPPVTEPEPEPEPEPSEPPAPSVTMRGPDGNKVWFSVSASPVKVRVQGFTGPPVWMQWTVDGKDVYSGKPTEPLEFEGQQIEINTGHLQGVELVINGQPFDHGLEGGPYILYFNSNSSGE